MRSRDELGDVAFGFGENRSRQCGRRVGEDVKRCEVMAEHNEPARSPVREPLSSAKAICCRCTERRSRGSQRGNFTEITTGLASPLSGPQLILPTVKGPVEGFFFSINSQPCNKATGTIASVFGATCSSCQFHHIVQINSKHILIFQKVIMLLCRIHLSNVFLPDNLIFLTCSALSRVLKYTAVVIRLL